MNVQEAVRAAKAFVAETFAEETPTNIGLEEVEFDERGGVWRVTIGFSRPWQQVNGLGLTAGGFTKPRSYKVVTVSDQDGKVLSIKNRAVNDAA